MIENAAVYEYYPHASVSSPERDYTYALASLDSFSEILDHFEDKPYTATLGLYLRDWIRMFYDDFCRAHQKHCFSPSNIRHYADALQARTDRVADYPKLFKYDLELEVLFAHGVVIPLTNRTREQFHYKRIEAWSAFLCAHPDAEKRFSRGFGCAIANCLYLFLTDDFVPRKDRRIPSAFLKRQLRQLDKKRRREVYLSVPGILKDSLKRFLVKKMRKTKEG